ncbi:uncharacterized protein LOC111268188 isoform X2 [Varroa jacobsoni]|uniref:uncharacterized protein LOC111268188 isoform X2 n=1 Tax=Varroa jacobsoni TaxID=62625 RepID=UPI000BF4F0DD|nr:uncharacterized protein LOC111268188 isoform X2 [Varroa jacobsoni]
MGIWNSLLKTSTLKMLLHNATRNNFYYRGYDSRQEIDLLVDRFQKASVRRKEKEYGMRKKKKRSGTPQQKEPQGSFQLQKVYEDSSESQICQGPTLRFMKKVFLSSAVKVSGRTEQQLPSYLEDEFILKCLVWHNIFRSRHQAAALRLSFPLCHEAQRLANEIAHTDRISFHESLKWPNGSCNSEDSKSPSAKLHERGFGQSLYVKYQPLLLVDSRMDVTAKEVVKHWYHGGAMRYDYSLHPEVLHTQGAAFSQLVWRDSTDLGIGKAHSLHNEAKVIVVALYTPRGNVQGLFVDNVRPYVKTCTTPIGSDVSEDESSEKPCASERFSKIDEKIVYADAVY